MSAPHTITPTPGGAGEGVLDLRERMVCQECDWEGPATAAGQHEHIRHGGAQTCWPTQ